MRFWKTWPASWPPRRKRSIRSRWPPAQPGTREWRIVSGESPLPRHLLERLHDVVCHGIEQLRAIDATERRTILVVPDQRRGLFAIDHQSIPHHRFFIVLPLGERPAAIVAGRE